MYVGAERLGHVFAQHRAHGLSAHAPYDLADQKAERVDVIAMRGAGLPPRLLAFERAGDLLPVERGTFRQRFANRWKAGTMRQDLPQRDRVLAALGKLRPDARDRCVEIDLVA